VAPAVVPLNLQPPPPIRADYAAGGWETSVTTIYRPCEAAESGI
jgi:hypothetical protein